MIEALYCVNKTFTRYSNFESPSYKWTVFFKLNSMEEYKNSNIPIAPKPFFEEIKSVLIVLELKKGKIKIQKIPQNCNIISCIEYLAKDEVDVFRFFTYKTTKQQITNVVDLNSLKLKSYILGEIFEFEFNPLKIEGNEVRIYLTKNIFNHTLNCVEFHYDKFGLEYSYPYNKDFYTGNVNATIMSLGIYKM